MELDKRIRDITDIKSVINSNKELIGKKGYFANSIGKFKDLSTCQYGIVHDYKEDDKCFCDFHFYTNRANESTWYSYFVPEDVLKPIEKNYRAFTNEEFFDLFDSGKLFSIRKKNERGRFIITEVYFNDNCEKDTVYVKLNHCNAGFGMGYLLRNDFEFYDGKEWKKFGIKE